MTALIIFVMLLTFLNLVVVTGILVGLPHGANEGYRKHYAGDVFVSAPEDKLFIKSSQVLIRAIEGLPEVTATSARYVGRAKIESNYKEVRAADELGDQINVQIAGINPIDEDIVAGLGGLMQEGIFITPGDTEGIVISKELLAEQTVGSPLTETTLEGVAVGEKVRVTIGGNVREFTVRGILAVKSQVAQQRAYILDSRMREMLNRFDSNVNEIAVKIRPNADATAVKGIIKSFDVASGAKVELAEEALGQFLVDIEQTFTILGNGVSSIGLVVASITIFIVIFINAITRRRYIGILKGIGISGLAIEFAYVLQAFVYVIIGAGLGLLLLYQVLVPYFDANPIQFPFSDGVLVAPVEETLFRFFLLVMTTIIAGYVPAKLITRQNTLDAILGR